MRVSFLARSVSIPVLSQEEIHRLDLKVLDLVEGMTVSHPLSTFSALIDVSKDGQIVRAFVQRLQNTVHVSEAPPVMAQLGPWLLT